jgi:hypothetical protein
MGHDWEAVVVGVQPRILLNRSFDQRWDEYLGYVLVVEGAPDDRFVVGITEQDQARHQFRAGDRVRGHASFAESDRDPIEYAGSRLEIVVRASGQPTPPPWPGPAPELSVYQERGYRRLAARTYDRKCAACIWGCRMAVEMTIDHWNPRHKEHRTETFCFGPLSCRTYKPGPTRNVPGRKGMSYTEEDWVDEDATGHRDLDE